MSDSVQIIPFRPRRRHGRSGFAPHATLRPPTRHEEDIAETDDFHHRMRVNLAAFAAAVAITGIGLWLAFALAEQRRLQDCVFTGRPACGVQIALHHE